MATEPKAATEDAKIDLFEDDDEFEEFEINEAKAIDKKSVEKMKVDGDTLKTELKLRAIVANVGCSSSSGAFGGQVDKLLHRKIEKLAELIVDSTAKAAYYAKCAWKSSRGEPTEEPEDYERPDLSFFYVEDSEEEEAVDENDSSEDPDLD